MKRLLLILGVTMASLIAASAAMAGPSGVNLAWTKCFGEGSPITNKNFACASNAGTNLLVCSFTPANGSATVNGNEVVIDILTTSSTAADAATGWWSMKNVGTCRPTSLSVNGSADAGNTVCLDEFAGQSTTGIGAWSQTVPVTGWSIGAGDVANHWRLKIAVAVPGTALAAVDNTGEYFSVNVSVNNAKSTGVGSCAGCSDPVCIVLNSINLTAGGGANDELIGNALAAGSNIVTWQGGVGGGTASCAAVPTHNKTWGAIKSLYR